MYLRCAFRRRAHHRCYAAGKKVEILQKEQYSEVENQSHCQQSLSPAVGFFLICLPFIPGPFLLLGFKESLSLVIDGIYLAGRKVNRDYADKDESAVSETVIKIKKATRNQKNDPTVILHGKSEVDYGCNYYKESKGE